MLRFVENVTRLWWLWLLPIIVPVGAFGAVTLTSVPQYDTALTIWVEPTNYLSVPGGGNGWTSPAQAQADVFRQLLSTRAVIVRVAENTPDLAPYTTTEAGRDFLEEYFARRMGITVRGAQLVEVSFRSTQAPLGPVVLNAFISVATDYVTTSTREQAQVAADFYQAQVPQREQEFAAASAALREFAVRNIPVIGEGVTSDRLLEQMELGELRRREELARRRYEETINNLERVRLQATATETVQQRGFRIVDQPFTPNRPTPVRREALVPIAAAVILPLLLCLGVTLTKTWLDRSLRGRAQVETRLGLPLLGGLPFYRRYRRPAALRRVSARALVARPALASES